MCRRFRVSHSENSHSRLSPGEIKFNNIAELCKGSTADSDSVCLGSNPSSAANNKRTLPVGVLLLFVANRGFVHSSCADGTTAGSHLSESYRGACSPVAKRKIFVHRTNTLVPHRTLPVGVLLLFVANRGFENSLLCRRVKALLSPPPRRGHN